MVCVGASVFVLTLWARSRLDVLWDTRDSTIRRCGRKEPRPQCCADLQNVSMRCLQPRSQSSDRAYGLVVFLFLDAVTSSNTVEVSEDSGVCCTVILSLGSEITSAQSRDIVSASQVSLRSRKICRCHESTVLATSQEIAAWPVLGTSAVRQASVFGC